MSDHTARANGPAEALSRSDGRLSDRLAERLAAMIAGGELGNGARLPSERDLMRRFGVGRSAVREAIAGLANQGLLSTRPGYRPIVRRPSYATAADALGRFVAHLPADEDGVWNLFESRIFIEAALARHAAARATGGDVEALRRALEENGAAVGDPASFYRTDVAFHGVLHRIPGNPIYPAVHEVYVQRLVSHWRRMERSPDIDRVNYAGHLAIFEAVLARDPDRAEAALRRHLEVAWELVRGTLAGRKAGGGRRPA